MRLRILALPNAYALAHVSRLVEVCKHLKEKGHLILFAGQGQFLEIAKMAGFETRPLTYIQLEDLVRAVRSGRLWELYPYSVIDKIMAAELGLMLEFRPDLVLLDNRPTARTSAESLGIKTASLVNVHMSSHRLIPFSSFIQFLRIKRTPLTQILDNFVLRIEAFFYDQLIMRAFNQKRRELGLPKISGHQHEEGDLTLLTDLPEFNPSKPLPPNTFFVGPITWKNDLPAPACLSQFDPKLPVVYFSLGSSSLQALLKDLPSQEESALQILVATGEKHKPNEPPPKGVFIEEFVNTDHALPFCHLVICHGGNGTIYQALRQGLPVVSVATHAEQAFGGKRLQELGVGRALMAKDIPRIGLNGLFQIAKSLLNDPERKKRSEKIRKAFSGLVPEKMAAQHILDFAEPSANLR